MTSKWSVYFLLTLKLLMRRRTNFLNSKRLLGFQKWSFNALSSSKRSSKIKFKLGTDFSQCSLYFWGISNLITSAHVCWKFHYYQQVPLFIHDWRIAWKTRMDTMKKMSTFFREKKIFKTLFRKLLSSEQL